MSFGVAIACGATSESVAQLEASESKSDRILVGYQRYEVDRNFPTYQG